MRSAFFEFNVAKTGLFLARGALEVVAHNTANAETPGFSRQYVEMRANWPIPLFNGKGMVGTGAEIYGIGQMRNAFLDTKYWSERAVQGEYQTKFVQMSMIERIMRELSVSSAAGSTGTTSGLDAFFNTLNDLKTSAADNVFRTNVIQSAQSLTRFINNTAESLKQYQRDMNAEVGTVVSRINSLGVQIASLNEQIRRLELDGSRANDLRDARALLVDELSMYVNVEVREIERNADFAAGKYPDPSDRGKSDKEFQVFINGNTFVAGKDSRGLMVVARDQDQSLFPLSNAKRNPTDVNGLFDVYFGDGGGMFDIYSPELKGQLKGLVDARDGNNANFFHGHGITHDFANGWLEMSPSAGARMDIITHPTAASPGELVVTLANGMKRTLQYTQFETLPGGDVRFTLTTAANTQANAMNFGGATAAVGTTTTYKGVPHYMDKLNMLVRTLTLAFNEGKDRNGNQIIGQDGKPIVGHINGYNAPQGGEKPQNLGTLFFTFGSNTAPITNYFNITAENFSLNPEIIANPWMLAAAVSPDSGESDNRVVMQFLDIRDYNGLFAEGKLYDFVIAMSSELGIDVNQAKKFAENYTEITTAIDIQRRSVSGVDLGEEMAMMIKFQHLYQSASRLINVIDGIYDTTINRMGV